MRWYSFHTEIIFYRRNIYIYGFRLQKVLFLFLPPKLFKVLWSQSWLHSLAPNEPRAAITGIGAKTCQQRQTPHHTPTHRTTGMTKKECDEGPSPAPSALSQCDHHHHQTFCVQSNLSGRPGGIKMHNGARAECVVKQGCELFARARGQLALSEVRAACSVRRACVRVRIAALFERAAGVNTD